MANLKAGPVSGYRSHGPERRGDASHASPSRAGGSPMVRVPFSDVRPLGDPQPLNLKAEARGLGRAVLKGRRVSRAIQQAQQPPGGTGTTWRATPIPSPGTPGAHGTAGNGGAKWTATVIPRDESPSPSYGGAALNNGGGKLANAMSGSSQPRAIAGPPKPGPGVRVTGRPPTSQAKSRAGRDRRAENFKAKKAGPTVIQGTAEDVTPSAGAQKGPAVHSYFGRDYVYGPNGTGTFTGESTAAGKAREAAGGTIQRPVKSTRKFNPDTT